MIAEAHNNPGQEHAEAEEFHSTQAAEVDNSKWEAPEAKQDDKSDAWAPRNPSQAAPSNAQDPPHELVKANSEVTFAAKAKEACEICGYNNHVTSDCHRMFCEICNYTLIPLMTV